MGKSLRKYFIGIDYMFEGDGYKTLKKLIEKEKGRTLNGGRKNNLPAKIKSFEFVGKIDGAHLNDFLINIRRKEITIERAYIEKETESQ